MFQFDVEYSISPQLPSGTFVCVQRLPNIENTPVQLPGCSTHTWCRRNLVLSPPWCRLVAGCRVFEENHPGLPQLGSGHHRCRLPRTPCSLVVHQETPRVQSWLRSHLVPRLRFYQRRFHVVYLVGCGFVRQYMVFLRQGKNWLYEQHSLLSRAGAILCICQQLWS